ncbi:MAG: sulfurtransferase [Bacteroidales bacterium]|nr:sulfurtransferase [Bacteroidales bacterium]MBN2756403.1 sulfurtransferase [Bacteroidales bacterium]
MKKVNLIIGLVLLSFISINSINAQFISAADLSKASDVIIVSARSAADYSKVHIKDAISVDVSLFESTGGIKGKLKSASEMAKILGSKGLSKTSKIVVYDDGKNIRACRLYWILKYLGATDVKILEGHMKAWKDARKPLVKTITSLKAATFTPSVNENIYATKAYVTSKLNNASVAIVDVQTKEEFDKGHIEGAINIDHKSLINPDGKFKSKAQLESIFKNAGVTSNKEVILYCASSARAGVAYVALTQILNYSKVRVFEDGLYGWK